MPVTSALSWRVSTQFGRVVDVLDMNHGHVVTPGVRGPGLNRRLRVPQPSTGCPPQPAWAEPMATTTSSTLRQCSTQRTRTSTAWPKWNG